jgi:deoxyribodipyrimidine photo-lyase
MADAKSLGIQPERVKALNNRSIARGSYVIYWMQASQRAKYNHALEYAILKANELKLPLVVYFGLSDRFPEVNARHYQFMLEGLKETCAALADRRIPMVIRDESPEAGAVLMARKAAVVVTDRGYLRIQREWRLHAAENIDCAMWQVETDVVVPVEVASGGEQYSAATLRPKIKSQLYRYLARLEHE